MRRLDLLLGLIQGPAELLPISSSAHARLLGGEEVDKTLEVALHAGSAVALLLGGERPRPWFAALTVAPPALAGLAFGDFVERRLSNAPAIAAGLVAGSAALTRNTEKSRNSSGKARSVGSAGAKDALAIGVAQAAALWPGVSRSAATLAMARARGFGPAEAHALSREALVPVLVAATVRKAPGMRERHLGGALAAALSTALADRLIGPPRRLRAFAVYRLALAVGVVWKDRQR